MDVIELSCIWMGTEHQEELQIWAPHCAGSKTAWLQTSGSYLLWAQLLFLLVQMLHSPGRPTKAMAVRGRGQCKASSQEPAVIISDRITAQGWLSTACGVFCFCFLFFCLSGMISLVAPLEINPLDLEDIYFLMCLIIHWDYWETQMTWFSSGSRLVGGIVGAKFQPEAGRQGMTRKPKVSKHMMTRSSLSILLQTLYAISYFFIRL